MILEVADIRIQTDKAAAFESAVAQALKTIFPKSKGFLSHELRRCIETPHRYLLLLTWETLEDHTVGFRGSALYTEWRNLVGGFFAQPPHVEHFERV